MIGMDKLLEIVLVDIQQYLLIRGTLEELILIQENDIHFWRHETLRSFSSKSCYKACFWILEEAKEIMGTTKIQNFSLVEIRNKCWTTYRSEKRGLDHPNPLCDPKNKKKRFNTFLPVVFVPQFWFLYLSPSVLGTQYQMLRCRERCVEIFIKS